MKYLSLSSKVQNEIGKKFVIPSDSSKVLVDENGLPYELYGSAKVALSVNPKFVFGGQFHTESFDRSKTV